jgi:hypothetical protein
MKNNSIIFIIIQLALLLSVNSQVRLNLTKQYFVNTTNPQATDNGFLAENSSDIVEDNVDNAYYTVTVNIGQGNDPFDLVIDTAESILWVSSIEVDTGRLNQFACNATSSCDSQSYPFPVEFGNGNLPGSIVQDSIDLGNGVLDQNQTIVLVDAQLGLADFPDDGILGLGFQTSIAGIPIGITPLLDNLQQQGLAPNKTFSIFLANYTADPNEQSDIILGGYDPTHMTAAAFSYYPLYDNKSWQIPVETVTFNGNSFTTTLPILFDSRASAIEAPKDAFATILAQAQQWDPTCASTTVGDLTVIQCTCNVTTAFPDISWVFNASDGNVYTVSGSQYIYPVNGTCIMDIAQADSWAVGHQFLMNYYTYYDEDNLQIGIAPANHT